MPRPLKEGARNIVEALTTKKVKGRTTRQIVQKIEPKPSKTAVKQAKPVQKGVRDFSKCPRCGSPTVPSITYSKVYSQFWRECVKCNTYINTYIPQQHQQDFHTDSHRYKGNFGGYGSGKTTTTREELYKHIFITPFGTGLIGANIMAQYEQTIKRDIEADFPAALIKDVSIQKSYMEFVNGYRLMYRPFDDPGKLRSLNLDFLAIVEGSEVDAQIFTIGKTRLRNIAATLPLKVDGQIQYTMSEQGVPIPIIKNDWRQAIVESNPDAGWIKQDVLLVSDKIQYNGPTVDKYVVNDEVKDPAISSHVTDTSCNAFLPPTYMTDVAKNRPQWWVNRYLHGSFTYAEGLVYPSALLNAKTNVAHVIPTAPIPKDWKRIFAFDYGLSDNSGGLWGAIDEQRGKLVIYKEFCVNDRNVETLATYIKDGSSDVPMGGWIRPNIIDPKSGVKRDYNKISLIDHFLEYGVSFVPGQVSVDARVFKLNTYFEQDRIEIMDCCKTLIAELKEYKFPSDLNKENGRGEKPEDKNNHMINPLEWIVMELPANPADILYGIFDKQGANVLKQKELDEQEYIRQLFNSSTGQTPRVYNPLATAENTDDVLFYGYNMGDQLGAYEGGIF
jgi:hypothetical protein